MKTFNDFVQDHGDAAALQRRAETTQRNQEQDRPRVDASHLDGDPVQKRPTKKPIRLSVGKK